MAFVVCCMFNGVCFDVSRGLYVGCCRLYVAWSLLHVVCLWYMLHDVPRGLNIVCCMLYVAWCMLYVVCCLLLVSVI